MQFYKEISTKVPVDKLNNYIKLHGFEPLDPSKVTANQVATSLKYIVEIHGLEAYQELENLLASEMNPSTKSISAHDKKTTTSCDCGCAECELKNNTVQSTSRSGSGSNAKTGSSVESVLKDKQSLLIIAATAIVLALILKK
jgi:hypothetical protein